MDRLGFRLATLSLIGLLAGCGGSDAPVDIAALPLDDPAEIQDLRENVMKDVSVTQDGHGSVLCAAEGTEVLRIGAWDTPGFGNEAVEVSGFLRLEMLYRNVSVDVWIDPVDADPRLDRILLPEFRRTQDWTPFTVTAALKPGEKLESVRVALFIEGPGRVWLDAFTVRGVDRPETER